MIDFQVLSDDITIPWTARDVPCTGVQLAADDVLLYCTAPVERLPMSIIVALDGDTGAESVVPSARLVPRS